MHNPKALVSLIKTLSITFTVFVILLIGGLIGYKVLDKKEISLSVQAAANEQSVSDTVNENKISSKRALLEAFEGKTLKILDIDRNKYISLDLEAIPFVKDEYDNSIPANMLKAGDLLEINYSEEQNKAVDVTKLKESWRKTNVKGIKLQYEGRQIQIGSSLYKVYDNALIKGKDDERVPFDELSQYDVLELSGAENEIYSIKVLEKQGTIEIGGLPSNKGSIEIDTDRYMSLQNMAGAMPVKAGKHKVIIEMEGYEAIVKEVMVKSGEKVSVTIDNPKEAYTEVIVQMMQELKNYSLQIDGRVYSAKDAIKIRQGKHHIIVSAQGYKTWEDDILFKEPMIKLNITLESLMPKVDEKKKETEQKEGAQETNKKENTAVDNSVNIVTNPIGAKVYIDGSYVGTSPYTTYLAAGEHSVSLQKEGYQYYTTTIKAGSSSQSKNGNNYIYTLIPNVQDSTMTNLLGGLLSN